MWRRVSDDGLFEGIGSLPVSPQPHEIVQFDYDHDGIVDLATICASGVVAILTGDGTGLFTYTAAIGVGNNPLNLAVGDLDRNGWQDIVVANTGEDTVTTVFFLGGGSVHVPAPKQRFGGDQPRGIAVSDLNGDGTLDLIVANRGSDNVTVARGTGNRSAPWADAQNLTTSNMDGARAVAIGDFDTDGRPDVFVGSQYSKTVAIFLNQSAWRGRQ